MNKPIIHWLAQIPDPAIAAAAVRNWINSDWESRLHKTSEMHYAVDNAFDWEETPEGWEFWLAVKYHQHPDLLRRTELPTLCTT